MNNGKVRIYELSRELNLDNKDILAVCERLNISVKSHSSTITESEAERIRKTAEKYIDRNLTSGKTAASDRGSLLGKEGSHSPNEPKKTRNFRNSQTQGASWWQWQAFGK